MNRLVYFQSSVTDLKDPVDQIISDCWLGKFSVNRRPFETYSRSRDVGWNLMDEEERIRALLFAAHGGPVDRNIEES